MLLTNRLKTCQLNPELPRYIYVGIEISTLTKKETLFMKSIATLIATLFAATAFATDAPKADAKPATPAVAVTAPAVTASPAPHKTEKKEVAKADATKSATPAPAAKDTKAEAVKK